MMCYRRRSMILDSVGFIVAFLIMGFANSFPLLLLGQSTPHS